MSVIGPIVSRGQVENAVRDVLQEWLHTYLIAVEEQHDITRGTIRRPQDWVRTTDPSAIPTRLLPTVAIISPGFAEDPDWDFDDDLGPTATFLYMVNVAVFARGRAKQRDEALDNAGILIAAVAAALLNKGATHPLIGAVDPLFDQDLGTIVDGNRERTLADAQALFTVTVPNALTLAQGPTIPVPPDSLPPTGEYGEADDVQITTSRLDP